MNKVFLLRPSEDWIVDRFVSEWYEDNHDISSDNIEDADVVWLLASWCYRHVNRRILSSKKVITTIHHVVEEKFDNNKHIEFQDRDSITDVYHVPNFRTESFVRNLTDKPVHVIPYWANQKIWKTTEDKNSLRRKYGLSETSYIIGSFQRDTEGYDLKTPKLEKGPDLLADFIIKKWNENNNLHVVLAGWRRQYIISRLENKGIPYTYIEKPSQKVINDLYQCLDLYPVTSRYEGGPQSLIECGLLGIPVVSTPVGMSQDLLSSSAIHSDVSQAFPEIPNVELITLPNGYKSYRDLIQSL
jgi:glycosyltransferase involved in cell wall biosynthesis